MTAFVFNARTVEPDQGRVGAVPKGWYPCIIKSTEIKPTSDGSGAYIAVSAQIVDGPNKGAMWFTNFNIKNNTEKAVEIGYKQLSALCYAVNVLDMTDTEQLKDKPFFVRLKFVPAEMDPQDPSKIKYEEKNEPMAYRTANDQAAIEAFKAQAAGGTPVVAKVVAPPPVTGNGQGAWAQAPGAGPHLAPAPVQAAPAPAQAAPAAGWTPPADAPSWGQTPAAAPAAAPAQAPAPETAPPLKAPWE